MQTNDLEPVRFSRLKLFSKSAAHYAHGYGDDTGPMRKGSALHRYLLGDKSAVVLYPGKVRRGKQWDAFQKENEGADILIKSEFKDVDGMRKSIERHPRAMALLDGIREERIEWEMGGRACAGTPDVVSILHAGSKRVVELKSSVSSAPDLFRWQAKRMAYHAQLAWYAHGLESALTYAPGPVIEQYIVAVESTPPYPVTVVRVTDKMRNKGMRQCRLWFEQLLVCERADHFPGYVEADVDWDDDDDLEWDDEEAA
jgi:hypothetical protein